VSLSTIKAAIDALYQAAYGADADLDARSPDGQISGGLAEMFDDLNSIAEDTVLGLVNPNGATGQMLSGLMALTGCPRHAATYSSAPATFTGTPGTVIATTKTVQSTEDGTTWSPTEQITIGGGGTATGTLRCTTSGRPASGRVPAATLTTIQTPVTGWAAVTNAVGTPGYNVELDPNGRIRRQQSVAVASQGMSDSLQAALINIPHIVDAVVWENDTPNPVVVGESGNTISKNTILVLVRTDGDASVDPTQTSDENDPVANAIYALKGHGCGTQGDTAKAPLDAVGVSHAINYSLATALDVDVKVTVEMRYGYPADGARQIENLITDWAAGSNAVTGKPNIKISGDDRGSLSWTDVLAAFVGQVPGFDFVSLAFSTDSGSTWTTGQDSLPIPFGSFVQISSVTVVET
jgi:hypothetical protein